jgi:hypothetical protein
MSRLSAAEAALVAVSASVAPRNVLQRCRADEECAECRQARLQRAAATTAAPPEYLPSIVGIAAGGPGRPLDSTTRGYMEARFGHDFGRVRLHTDATSGLAAQAVGARAYTVGQDIYFGPGSFDPAGTAGRRLLAHELTHTIQQGDAGGPVMLAGAIDAPDAPLEREAEAAAASALAGAVIPAQHVTAAPRPQLAADPFGPETRPRDVNGKSYKITRTLERRKCHSVAKTQTEFQVLYPDEQTNAFGVRWRVCKGEKLLALDASLNYDRLRQLAETLQTGVAPGAIRPSLGGEAGVKIQLGPNFSSELRARTEQGLTSAGPRDWDFRANLRITPDAFSLEVGGGVSQTGPTTTETVTGRADVGDFQPEITVTHVEPGPAGGSSTTVSGRVSWRRGGGRVGPNISASTAGGGTVMFGFGTIEPIPREKAPDCYACECPPPLPKFECVVVSSPTPPEPKLAERQVKRLHYAWWKAEPENPKIYADEVQAIIDVISTGYSVESIVGYASPEGKSEGEYLSKRGPTNRLLSLNRAEAARTAILKKLAGGHLASVVLPAAIGQGEPVPLGFEGGKEIADRDLSSRLREKLATMSSEEQLDILGIGPGLSTNDRGAALKNIASFVSGKSDGADLLGRARWEKIFPYIRRVDVTLNAPPAPPPTSQQAKDSPADCPTDTADWALKNMPAIPPGNQPGPSDCTD